MSTIHKVHLRCKKCYKVNEIAYADAKNLAIGIATFLDNYAEHQCTAEEMDPQGIWEVFAVSTDKATRKNLWKEVREIRTHQ